MDDGDYDEFGNYIGPDLGDSESDSEPDSLQQSTNDISDPFRDGEETNTLNAANGLNDLAVSVKVNTTPVEPELTDANSRAVVLAEDREHYPSAQDVFGPDTEVLIEEEDSQPITEPIIAPKLDKTSSLAETKATEPMPKYKLEYFAAAVLSTPGLIRNVALIGGLHHGKTSLADMLFEEAYEMNWDQLRERDFPVRYMDTRKDERQLQISLKTSIATLLLPSRTGKSYGITIMDTPGHLNFQDEAIAAMNLADGTVVIVDVAEGMTLATEILLKKAAAMSLDIVLVVSKIDRLITELRIPPQDAYHKIRDVIDSVNEILAEKGVDPVSPSKGNVTFAASNEKIMFTLVQFASEYISANGGQKKFPMSADKLAKCMWGDVYYNKTSRTFSRKGGFTAKRTFVEFILEPLYKLHSAVVGLDVKELAEYLSRNHLLDEGRKKLPYMYRGRVQKSALKADVWELLRTVNTRSFGMGSVSGFVDMLVQFVSPPDEASLRKLEALDLPNVDPDAKSTVGNQEMGDGFYESWKTAMADCAKERDAPLTAYVGKLIPDEKDEHFDGLARIMSGELRAGDSVRILGDDFHPYFHDEDQATATVSEIFLPVSRFTVPVTRCGAGQIVLLRGISESIGKSATIVCTRSAHSRRARVLKPLMEQLTSGVVKVAVEPVRPAELPKMVVGLQKCMKTFPSLQSRVEDSGEHTIVGSGELYMDCVLRDLRENYGNVEVKVSDPVVPFAETIIEISKVQCYAKTPNGLNRIEMIAEPLEEDFMKALQDGAFDMRISPDNQSKLLQLLKNLGMDAFSARSLWALGPHSQRGPNALFNDILDPAVRQHAEKIKDSIIEGFKWATRKGPLTDEPVRGVKFRITNVTVAPNASGRTLAQISPASRRVAYSAFLTACPRLVEPIYVAEVVCPPEAGDVARTLLSRRRGNVVSNTPIPATPLVAFRMELPVLDSFGFEPDLRNLTQGAAFCTLTFSHWALLPGDPLDKSVTLRPLEPAGRKELARECMVKTRRRKGMPDDVSLLKYFDDPQLVALAKDDEEWMHLL